MKDLHKLFQIPRNCQCKWLLVSFRAPGTFASCAGFLVKFCFCTDTPGSIEWLNLFFFRTMMLMWLQKSDTTNCHVTQQTRAPFSTWCTLGVSPSTPPWTRRSRRDAIKTRAAAHAGNLHHRKCQPCSALRFSTAGSARARALARCLMNDTASKDHPPPTSKTSTNLARCPCWTSSRQVLSLRRLASLRTTPSLSAAPRLAVPSQCKGKGRVNRQLGPTVQWEPVNHHLQMAGVVTHVLPRSQQQTHVYPEPLPAHTMQNGGQKSQENGHIGMCVKLGAMGDASAGTKAPEKTENQELRIALVVGLQQPTRAMTAPRHLPNWRVALPPSLPCANDGTQMDLVNVSATCGWRCMIISKKSPQLAQCNNNARLHIGNRGNRSRRVGWCWRTACNWCSTNSGCPRGVPRNFCKLLWVSCEIFVLHGYAWIHWATTSCPTTAYRWLFRESQLSLRTLWSAVIKLPKLSARSAASPLRLLHGALVILVRLQISQFRSLGKWIWTLCLPKSSRLFVVGSREASIDELPWEPPYNGISSSTKFSLNSCNHSGISESSEHNGSPRAVVVSFLLVFGVLLAWSSSGLPDQQIQTLALDRCHC